jgi:hypothetical protein
MLFAGETAENLKRANWRFQLKTVVKLTMTAG